MIARLPCFATGTPVDATTSAAAVEMLNVPAPSPPVPTTSIAPSGASTRSTRSRIADANPASSSTVSPRIRRRDEQRRELGRRRLAVHHGAHREAGLVEVEGAALDDRSPARPGRGSLIARPRRSSAMPGGREGPARGIERRGLALAGLAQEVREEVRALRRQDALGVELDALERQRDVAQAHHDLVLLAHRGDPQLSAERRGDPRTASGSARP